MPVQLLPIVPGLGPAIVISRPVMLIGRHAECDIRIDSPRVSRRHCCVALAYDRLLIRDLGSRNGVRVNGRIVEEARLDRGDEVAIAHLLYRLEELPATVPATPRVSKPAAVESSLAMPPIIDLDDDFVPLDD